MNNFEAIHKIIMFGFNYNHDFISKVWEGRMAEHLQTKFNYYHNNHGSTAVFNVFYASLDTQNQQMLINWILANYRG